MPMSFANESDFWKWRLDQDGFHASLNAEAVVVNGMRNLMRLDEAAVLDFLRERGYTVVKPEGDA